MFSSPHEDRGDPADRRIYLSLAIKRQKATDSVEPSLPFTLHSQSHTHTRRCTPLLPSIRLSVSPRTSICSAESYDQTQIYASPPRPRRWRRGRMECSGGSLSLTLCQSDPDPHPHSPPPPLAVSNDSKLLFSHLPHQRTAPQTGSSPLQPHALH